MLLLLVPAVADGDWSAYLRAWLAALALCSPSTSCWWSIYPAGMGFGDVKLAGVLGLVARLAGVGRARGRWLPGLPPRGRRRWGPDGSSGKAGRKSKIPFGPFMLLGALLAILWGGRLWDTYVDTLT